MRGVTIKIAEWLLSLCGLCLLFIAFIIGGGVMMNLVGVSQIISFESSYWLIGRGVNFNTLMGFQVLLFATAVMLAIGPVLLLDRHVRVDVLHARLSHNGKRVINLIGHLIFAIPFFGFLLVPAYRFAERSYLISERSADGGLSDIYVIKAMLPAGIVLMLMVLVYLVVLTMARGRRGGQHD